MSASRERKKRIASEQPAAGQPAAKKKLSEGLLLAVAVFLVLAIVFGSIAIYRVYWRHATVLTVGEHEVSTVEFNFFFNSAVNELVNTYGSYLSLLGMDPSVPLTQQNAPGTQEDAEPQTWAAYLADSAKTTAVNYYTVCDAAAEAGFALSQEQLDEIESQISSISTYATLYGTDADQYIENMYGSGCDLDAYRDFLTLSYTYSAYISSLEYTDEEIAARYDKDPTEFDSVSFELYTASASNYAGKNDDGTTAEITDEDRAAAKAAADTMTAYFIHNSKVVDYTEQSKASVTSSIGEEAANWLFDASTAEGSVKQFETENTYYVVRFGSRTDNDYQTVNAMQIYIKNDTEEVEEGEQTAAERLAAVLESLEKDSSEENFQSLITSYSDNTNSSTYTRAAHKSVSNQEVNEWLFDGKRTEGEYKTFETSEGAYVVLFQSYDKTYKDLLVSNTLTNEWFEALTGDVAYTYNADHAMHCHVDFAVGEVYNLSSNG